MRHARLTSVLILAALFPLPSAVQAQGAPPTGVTGRGNPGAVNISWTPPGKARGVTYRVLRAPDPKTTGVDVTKPLTVTTFDDGNVKPGMTYFYQVIAVYDDGTYGAADPVMVTVPADAVQMSAPPKGAVLSGTPLRTSGAVTGRSFPSAPTAVTGVTVTGTTTAFATVSWQPVPGAATYSIARQSPGGYTMTAPFITGVTATTWKDNGPSGVGFQQAGTYLYEVSALLADGSSVKGQASWTRPAPVCSPPSPGQTPLAALDPLASLNAFSAAGPYPNGPVFFWGSKSTGRQTVGATVERSLAGTNAWTLAASSCTATGLTPLAFDGMGPSRFVDMLGVAPGTAYVYRIALIAANGEMGWNTVPWTAPSVGLVRLLDATATTTTITFRWRYEPPPSNAPISPTAFLVSAPYGLSKSYASGPCSSLAGCSTTVPADHKGVQTFTVTARWGTNQGSSGQAGYSSGGLIMGTLSRDTTITVP